MTQNPPPPEHPCGSRQTNQLVLSEVEGWAKQRNVTNERPLLRPCESK